MGLREIHCIASFISEGHSRFELYSVISPDDESVIERVRKRITSTCDADSDNIIVVREDDDPQYIPPVVQTFFAVWRLLDQANIHVVT